MSAVPSLCELSFSGDLLRRGFWLYVWEVTPPRGRRLYYVGRTGDNSSINAQSPFNRMGQHLGFAKNSSMLRRHLGKYHVDPSRCRFRLVAYGPVLRETQDRALHFTRRDKMAGLEKALADAMRASGYEVMNDVKTHQTADKALLAKVVTQFRARFPRLH